VVLNPSAGSLIGRPLASLLTELDQCLTGHGLRAQILVAPDGRLGEVLQAAVAGPARLVVAGGGDGTVAAAAAALRGSGKTLGVLPLGTINLSARDLGIPTPLPQAVAVLAQGQPHLIDLAELNGRPFLNNAVLGLYAGLVRVRERQRGVRGLRKWLSLAAAVYRALRYYNLVEVTVDLGQGPQALRTPALAVSNNPYRAIAGGWGGRSGLDAGRLGVYLARHRTRLGLIRLMAELVLGGWRQDADFESLSLTELVVASRHRRLKVSLDGEVCRLTPPLWFRICPQALAVMVPAPGVGPGGSGLEKSQ